MTTSEPNGQEGIAHDPTCPVCERASPGGLCSNCNDRRIELEAVVPFLIKRGTFAETFADWSQRDRRTLLKTTYAYGDADAPTITCECGHEAPVDEIDDHACEVTA